MAELGGREADVTVLFADLAGFTSFSDGRSPMDVVEMLNAYWATAVPIITEREGGLIERFAGDAILVVFNALEDQPDHAIRAVRAARSIQRAIAETCNDHPDWPRFRIGINSGSAALGNVGAGAHRRHHERRGSAAGRGSRRRHPDRAGDVRRRPGRGGGRTVRRS
jgi:adenylate cyclase